MIIHADNRSALHRGAILVGTTEQGEQRGHEKDYYGYTFFHVSQDLPPQKPAKAVDNHPQRVALLFPQSGRTMTHSRGDGLRLSKPFPMASGLTIQLNLKFLY
jgi:hypothetical protein